MTYEEADRLVTIIHMNFAAFLPPSPEASAVKKGMWCGELQKFDYKRGLDAVKMLLQTQQYPPTMYDLRQALGIGAEITRDDLQARLPGPQFGSEEGFKAMYTSDPDRINKLMADLDAEIAKGKWTKTREEAIAENDRRNTA